MMKFGPFVVFSNFIEVWLVKPLTARLLFVSAILVVAITPLLFGLINVNSMAWWGRLLWSLVGVLGTVSLFLIWPGMWIYWSKLDPSGVWSKRAWFLILLLGFWFGSAAYYFSVYLPQALQRERIEG